jgi:hypothetical protein
MTEQAKQVPLIDRLKSVPADARLTIHDGRYSTSYYPVGAMVHEAAAELRRLHEVNAELLEALKRMVLDGNCRDANYRALANDQARAAIAKAEGKT